MSDFASEYGIRMAAVTMSWREFHALLVGLLQTDSRLWRHFTPQDGGA